MVEITLTITRACSGEAGTISLKRVDGADAREMGVIKFEDVQQEKWLLEVLMKWHTYVTLVESSIPCDPTIQKPNAPC